MHFAREVWLSMTGEDIEERLAVLNEAAETRRVRPSDVRRFRKLERPISPCIVMMRRPRTEPHMGIYLRRRVLHMGEQGPRFEVPAVALMAFKTVSYYA